MLFLSGRAGGLNGSTTRRGSLLNIVGPVGGVGCPRDTGGPLAGMEGGGVMEEGGGVIGGGGFGGESFARTGTGGAVRTGFGDDLAMDGDEPSFGAGTFPGMGGAGLLPVVAVGGSPGGGFPAGAVVGVACLLGRGGWKLLLDDCLGMGFGAGGFEGGAGSTPMLVARDRARSLMLEERVAGGDSSSLTSLTVGWGGAGGPLLFPLGKCRGLGLGRGFGATC